MTALAEPRFDARSQHLLPVLRAARTLGEDMLSTIVYAALIAATRDLVLATGVAIAAGLVSIAWTRMRGRPIDAMQWLSVGLVIVFGGAGLLLHDARFVMIKPTIIYLAVAAVMLKAGWMARYMPEIVHRHGGDVVRAFEVIWALSMLGLAAANAVLVMRGDRAAWTVFIAVAPLGSKLALFLLQYLSLRLVVERRVRAARLAA